MKAYSGVAVLSRIKPEAVSYGFDDGGDVEDARLLRVVIQGIPIKYICTAGFGLIPKYQYKLNWYERLRNTSNRIFPRREPAIWCGDMNVAPRPIDVHSPEKHLKHVCYHEDARNAYGKTVAWGFEDVFCKLYPDRQQFTFSTTVPPVPLPPTKGGGSTISLATPTGPKCQRVDVDLEPRRATLLRSCTCPLGATSASLNLVRSFPGQGASAPAPGCLPLWRSTGSNNNCSAIRVRRFCSINGSTIDPQLMHRHTNVSDENPAAIHPPSIPGIVRMSWCPPPRMCLSQGEPCPCDGRVAMEIREVLVRR